MDNILVCGKEAESYAKTLRLVLRRLEKAGFEWDEHKCKISLAEVKFLSYIIYAKMIQAETKIEPLGRNVSAPASQSSRIHVGPAPWPLLGLAHLK